MTNSIYILKENGFLFRNVLGFHTSKLIRSLDFVIKLDNNLSYCQLTPLSP